jgi:hypothetical protein
MTPLLALGLCGLLLLSQATSADSECDVELQQDLRVSSESLQVYSESTLLYEIRQGGYLNIDRQELELKEEQRKLAEHYAGQVAAWAAQWIELASSTIEFMGESLELALTEAFGKDSPAVLKSGHALEKIKADFDRIAKSEDGSYFISAQDFDELEDSFSEDLEADIGAALDTIFTEMSKKLVSGEGSFLERLKEFITRADRVGQELEQQARVLAERSRTLCEEMKEIRKLEKSVSREIPQLAPYPIVDD